jgi:PBSX family phage portal protein
MTAQSASLSQANQALVDHAHAADDARAVIIKAHVVGSGDVQASAAIQAVEASERTFGELGALPPPFDPEALCILFENSSALRPNIDAYCANIDSHGHRFEPVLDFDAEDAIERVAGAVHAERLWLKEHGKLAEGEALQPTKEEAAALVKALDEQARTEKIRLDNWSEFCCADTSLAAVRRQTRMDLETLGNAYWEILRNVAGEIALIVHVPGFTVRLLPLDSTPVPVEMRIKVSPISYQTIQITRCFRRYVQVVEGMSPVYFKELGDPRVVSRRSGKVFESVEALQREDETDQPATEILHFKVHSPRSAYGVPRWMGTLLEVLGSRQAAEVNFFYFQNKSVPPLALLVSGGRLSQSSVPRIERFIEEHVKGKKNFHKILIIEAESTRTASNERAGRISLEFHPLTSAQQTDALFQHYDERNIDKIGAAFRLPRLLRGDIRDFNRSTALAALHFAEEQIFQPERQEFDFLMNRKLLADMGIRFWRFCSNAPVTRDPQVMAETVKNLVTANVLTPEEGRRLAGDVFNIEFRAIRAPWVKQPIPLTLAGFPVESDKQTEMLHSSVPSLAAAPPAQSGSDRHGAQAQSAAIEDVGTDAHERFLRLKPEQMERDVIYVPDEELASWLEPESAPSDGQEGADA